MVLERASSSEATGMECDNSEAYRFTIDMLSIKDETLLESSKTVKNFFRINDGGRPKSGPVSNSSHPGHVTERKG